MEKYLGMVAEQSGFRHLELRPANPYGPRQSVEAAQGIVAVAMARIARGEPVTIRGDGSSTKDYIFVDDFTEACVELISKPKATGPFNIGSGQGMRLLDLIAEIETVVGRKAELVFEPAQTGDVSANVLDISKIRETTGWTPTTSLNSGIARTWDWMKTRIARSRLPDVSAGSLAC